MKITYHLDVLSLWCFYAYRSLERLLEAHGERIELDWRIALIRGEAPLGYDKPEQTWFYDRAAYLTGSRLNPDWLPGRSGSTLAANLAAEASRSLGVTDRRVLGALMTAAMEEGRPLCEAEEAARVVAETTGLTVDRVLLAMQDEGVRARVHETSAELAHLGVDQRPVMVFENVIPDRAILSGIWAYEPMAAVAEAMLRDEDRFLEFNRTHPLAES